MTSETVFLDLAQVLAIHRFQIEKYGGMAGIRDRDLLESALAQPQAWFAGEYLHSDLYDKAGAYLYHLCMNHPFIDGNKRVALHAALVFLLVNGARVDVPPDELFRFTCDVASGRLEKVQVADFLRRPDPRNA